MTIHEFTALDLHPRVLSGVEALGFKTLTPIQHKAIPIVMQGGDVMGLAQTGTGKTAAFVLPILHRLMDGPRGHIRALILAPTRELAQQIYEDINVLGRDTGLRATTIYGGVSINPQFRQLRKGVEIVVACPGRLLDHVEQRTINLDKLEVLVLDEADQMFDMGFLPNVRRILQQLPRKRQSLLFSATMPKEIRQLAEDILVKPATVQVGHSAPATTVKQAIFPVPDHLKTQLLIEILKSHKTGSVLIFTRTKHRAKSVAEKLEAVGYPTASLQGNLSQAKRQKALNDFRDGKLPILVATDIASRGIDVAKITHVINYDMPATVEAYTHRIGRTGRANKLGDAFTLVTGGDMGRVRAIERVLNAKIEQRKLDNFDYGAKVDRSSVISEHEPYDQKERRPSRGHDSKRDFGDRPERRSSSAGRSDSKFARKPAGRSSEGGRSFDRDRAPRGDAKEGRSFSGERRGPAGRSDSGFGRKPAGRSSEGGRSFDRDRAPRGDAKEGRSFSGERRGPTGRSDSGFGRKPAGRSSEGGRSFDRDRAPRGDAKEGRSFSGERRGPAGRSDSGFARKPAGRSSEGGRSFDRDRAPRGDAKEGRSFSGERRGPAGRSDSGFGRKPAARTSEGRSFDRKPSTRSSERGSSSERAPRRDAPAGRKFSSARSGSDTNFAARRAPRSEGAANEGRSFSSERRTSPAGAARKPAFAKAGAPRGGAAKKKAFVPRGKR